MNILEKHPLNPNVSLPRKEKLAKRLAPLAILAASGSVFIGVQVKAAQEGPRFSETTHTVVATPDDGISNDTVWDMAKTVDGYNNVDIREIVSYIEKTNPDLADGLDKGESVEVPDSVR